MVLVTLAVWRRSKHACIDSQEQWHVPQLVPPLEQNNFLLSAQEGGGRSQETGANFPSSASWTGLQARMIWWRMYLVRGIWCKRFAKHPCHKRSTAASHAWLKRLPNSYASIAESLSASNLAALSVDNACWELRQNYSGIIVWAQNALELKEVSSPIIKHTTLPTFMEFRWLLVSRTLQQLHTQVIRNGCLINVLQVVKQLCSNVHIAQWRHTTLTCLLVMRMFNIDMTTHPVNHLQFLKLQRFGQGLSLHITLAIALGRCTMLCEICSAVSPLLWSNANQLSIPVGWQTRVLMYCQVLSLPCRSSNLK